MPTRGRPGAAFLKHNGGPLPQGSSLQPTLGTLLFLLAEGRQAASVTGQVISELIDSRQEGTGGTEDKSAYVHLFPIVVYT